MKKVMVIGCPGSGKSTFSKALHKAIEFPLFHLDMLYWNADKNVIIFKSREEAKKYLAEIGSYT